MKMEQNKRYRMEDPELIPAFLKHCETGFSPRMFIPRIVGASKSYTILYRTNPEFREINDRFKRKVMPKIYVGREDV